MPAGAGTARYESWGLVAGIVCLSFLPPPATPLDSGFRRNDEVGGRNDALGGRNYERGGRWHSGTFEAR